MTVKTVVLREKGETLGDAVVHDPDQTYHLQFSSPPQNGQFADQDVAVFLRRIFNGAAPLEYDQHRLIQVHGKPAVQFRFKTSIEGKLANMSLDMAAEALCKAIFEHRTRDFFFLVTADSIFGVSAVSIAWQNWFNRAFFAAHQENAPGLLDDLFDTFTTDYFSPWALVVPVAVVLRLPIGALVSRFGNAIGGAFAGNAVFEGAVGHSTTNAVMQGAVRILEAVANRQNRRPRDVIQHERNEARRHYEVTMDKAINALSRCADFNAISIAAINGGLSPAAELSNALFDLAKYAGLMLTSNEELLKTFLEDRQKTRAQGYAAFAGANLSAFIFTGAAAEIEAAAAGAAIGGPMVMLAVGAIGAAVCVGTVVVKFRAYKTLTKKVDILNQMSVFIHQSWRLAYDTEQFLIWVHDTNMAVPTNIDNVDSITLDEWNNFLTVVQQQGGGFRATADTVSAYLATRRQTLIGIRQHIEQGENILRAN